MNKSYEPINAAAVKSEEEAVKLLEKLFKVAEPHVIFSEPIEVGNQKIFTASDISVGLGVGVGFGEGPMKFQSGKQEELDNDTEEMSHTGKGGGGGGGGGASGRPIAVISVSEDQGVRVEPIIDTTRVALAFFTTVGSMFFMLSKMKKSS